jgi:hypothetical protein
MDGLSDFAQALLATRAASAEAALGGIIDMNQQLCPERDRLRTEIACLREFYNAWVEFHKITKNKQHRKQQEAAALRIAEARQAVVRFDRMYE